MATPNTDTATTAKRRGPPKVEDRIAPIVTAIATDVAIPEIVSKARRGSKSQYPFDALAVGQSFGVTNKTLKQMQSVVSTQNRRHLVPKIDANGNKVMRTSTAKTEDGRVVEMQSDKPVMLSTKVFVVAEVDPKKDLAKASVRVWRKS